MPGTFRRPLLTAILRGIRPHEIIDVAAVLVERGVDAIEVPLNSPDPLASIERLAAAFGQRCLCGAGTVLQVEQVEQVHAVGGRLLVAPNTDAAVIARALALGMVPMPGMASATEAFAAIAAGATELKLFPASSYGPDHLRALRGQRRVRTIGGLQRLVQRFGLRDPRSEQHRGAPQQCHFSHHRSNLLFSLACPRAVMCAVTPFRRFQAGNEARRVACCPDWEAPAASRRCRWPRRTRGRSP